MVETIQSKFELSIALALATWPALTYAIQNSWGGLESSDKRDFLAGAISDLITAEPDADVDYVEEFVLQYMNDEFEANVEDGSGEEVAAKIVGLRKLTLQGDFVMVDDMYRQWQERQANGGSVRMNFQVVDRDENEDDTDSDSDDVSEEDDGDVEMREAPALVNAPKEKVQPKVDDDGFTEVVGKKRRG